ncbi:hypothetical protein FNV43_RR19315 [Rhamnella rubrinervis]|uniref:FLZ-type domain-containing protein n=1 Tax=Rhamnella rubrinervis TaxID=2594499 RepID=A0A8K0E7Q7_9ROSA|nr:hypothetical protein FNV43_RR19315 [Rhamnella rubrinervis]
MLLGKRSRPEIRRTTSMTGITSFDLSNVEAQEQPDLYQNPIINGGVVGPELADHHQNYNNMSFGTKTSYEEHQHHFLSTMLSPRNNNHGRNSQDFVETAHFLRTCSLCKRRLASGRDIYMYRGDTAFCSLECREQQMKQDERKEKCKAMATKNNDDRLASSSTENSKGSGKSETVAAA